MLSLHLGHMVFMPWDGALYLLYFPLTKTNIYIRVMESTLRTANNLLERLHASFFFYILTTPGNFLTFGSFLPSVLLISISLMIGGLRQYVDAGWTKDASSPLGPTKQSTNVVTSVKWVRQRRPVLPVIVTMLWCHIAGALLFYVAPMLPAWVSVNPPLLLKLHLTPHAPGDLVGGSWDCLHKRVCTSTVHPYEEPRLCSSVGSAKRVQPLLGVDSYFGHFASEFLARCCFGCCIGCSALLATTCVDI